MGPLRARRAPCGAWVSVPGGVGRPLERSPSAPGFGSEAVMWTLADRALVGDYGAGQALSDDQHRLLAPLIPPAKPGGRPRKTDMRRLLDGLFFVVRTGCQWRHLPPPPTGSSPSLVDHAARRRWRS